MGSWEVTNGPEFRFLEPENRSTECAPFIFSPDLLPDP